MTIDGKPHPHSFYRDGAETRNVEAVVRKGKGIDIRSGIAGLLVLKSTGSQFHSFIRDEYTTLPETWDRILSTDVDCGWSWKTFSGINAVQDAIPKFDKAWQDARTITMKIFAEEDSPSVQNTMYKMGESVLDAVPEVEAVDYSLPKYVLSFPTLSDFMSFETNSTPKWLQKGQISCRSLSRDPNRNSLSSFTNNC
jgi:urate oxidase